MYIFFAFGQQDVKKIKNCVDLCVRHIYLCKGFYVKYKSFCGPTVYMIKMKQYIFVKDENLHMYMWKFYWKLKRNVCFHAWFSSCAM